MELYNEKDILHQLANGNIGVTEAKRRFDSGTIFFRSRPDEDGNVKIVGYNQNGQKVIRYSTLEEWGEDSRNGMKMGESMDFAPDEIERFLDSV